MPAGRKAAGKSAAMPAWAAHLDDYYWLHDMLRISVGVPAWVIQWDGKHFQWMDLSLVLPPLAPYHFEIAQQREGERDAYHLRSVKRVLANGQALEGSLNGFCDLFVPVGRRGRGGHGGYRRAPASRDPHRPHRRQAPL